MAKDPAFLFYPGDFNTGTQFFTDEQVGKYMRLLMAQHQHGHLSDDQVIHICKSYDNHIMSKFNKDKDGFWYNERLESEVVKRKEYCKSRGENKKGKTLISKSYDSHMEDRNRNEDIVVSNNIYGPPDSKHFVVVKAKYANEKTARVNGKEGLIAIHESQGTILNLSEHAEKYMRSRNGKVLNDFSHLQADYNKFIESQFK